MFKNDGKANGCEDGNKLRPRADLPMKKVRSVDFSRMTICSVKSRPTTAASGFSQRAARGSFKDLRNDDGLSAPYSSDCSLNRIRKNAPPSLPENDPLHPPQEAADSWPPEQLINEAPALFSISIPRFSLAKLSIIFLAFATICDMALTKMSTFDGVGRPRASLGSSAISSLTDKLSPILPFAGGLDLRRNDYWSVSADGSWIDTLQSVVVQVTDAFARKEESTKPNAKGGFTGLSPTKSTSHQSLKKFESTISAQQPFVKIDVISQLTLGDIGECFKFAVVSSQVGFNMARFLTDASTSLRAVVLAMQDAVARSRGNEFADWSRPLSDADEISSIDALKFAAAMRVFAEWRLLRQVPPGYKGFAMGMSLGHKDVVQNIIKIEEAIHGLLQFRRNLCQNDGDTICSDQLLTPTLRELLSNEVDSGVHPANRLPYLTEKSAGMGLLWVSRQLAYQTQIFDNVLALDNESGGKSRMKDAVSAAYTHVYGQYHGWAVQKIFNYSFQAAPEAEEILRFMNPHRLKELLNDQRISHITGDCAGSECQPKNEDENPIQQFLNHIGGEWDKFAFNVVKVFNNNAEPPTIILAKDARQGRENVSAVDENFVTREMVKDAHVQISTYLTVAKPLLNSVASLFDDLNMNDPTRV